MPFARQPERATDEPISTLIRALEIVKQSRASVDGNPSIICETTPAET